MDKALAQNRRVVQKSGKTLAGHPAAREVRSRVPTPREGRALASRTAGRGSELVDELRIARRRRATQPRNSNYSSIRR
jgi:hypothetical protein